MKISKTHNRRKRSSWARRGVAAVEFAFAAPVLFFIIFICAEFARISMMRNLAQSAAYEAARISIVEGADLTEAITEAERILARLGTSGATVIINEGEEIDASTNVIDVMVEIPLQENSFFFPMIYEGKFVRAECTLRTERYKGFYDSNSN